MVGFAIKKRRCLLCTTGGRAKRGSISSIIRMRSSLMARGKMPYIQISDDVQPLAGAGK